MYQRPFEKLIVWQEAHMLCLRVYDLTKKFPMDERFRLVDQLCRASSSVPTNIAEGNSHRSRKQKAHYFEISHGSLEEVHYHSRLSKDLHYLTEEEFTDIDKRTNRISYLLQRLRDSL